MKSRPTENPPSPYRDVRVTYDDGDGPPPSSIKILEDHSRSILAHNDSPDLGFDWSVNPYRGCLHACAYCLGPDTPVMLGDSRTRRIADLAIGDEIYGTRVEGTRRSYVRTRVLDAWSTIKDAYRVELSDGTDLVASADHRFLSDRGWRYVLADDTRRAFIRPTTRLLGPGRFAIAPDESREYQRGYLCGMIRGDATRRRGARVALVDLEALHRTKRYLAALAVEASAFQFLAARAGYREVSAVRTSSRITFESVGYLIDLPAQPELDWHKGFLAGIFDAEGEHDAHGLRISSADRLLVDRIAQSLDRLAFDAVIETAEREPRRLFDVRVRGGLAEHLRFFHTTGPAISRKWSLEDRAVKGSPDRRVVSITPLGKRRLFDITTGTGDFIANGVVSHNCYARPTHEYLDLGAGTDFDTKIVVKPKAAELLRAAFDKPSWKGELVMFSGVTDCYQAIERELELTKQCLEVCLEYRNPVAIISKSALIERDVGLLVELAREAGCHVSVSLAFADAELARKIEPWAPAPARRLKVIETLAKAGLSVGVMCAPVMPGLNDDQMVRVLESAAGAGATSAGWVLLRLPGAVKQVFEDRVRVALPLAADKILHRIRETRGGDKLYDPRFGTRGRGEGVYAQTIAALFETTVKRLKLGERDGARLGATMPSRFQRPARGGQLSLF